MINSTTTTTQMISHTIESVMHRGQADDEKASKGSPTKAMTRSSSLRCQLPLHMAERSKRGASHRRKLKAIKVGLRVVLVSTLRMQAQESAKTPSSLPRLLSEDSLAAHLQKQGTGARHIYGPRDYHHVQNARGTKYGGGECLGMAKYEPAPATSYPMIFICSTRGGRSESTFYNGN